MEKTLAKIISFKRSEATASLASRLYKDSPTVGRLGTAVLVGSSVGKLSGKPMAVRMCGVCQRPKPASIPREWMQSGHAVSVTAPR